MHKSPYANYLRLTKYNLVLTKYNLGLKGIFVAALIHSLLVDRQCVCCVSRTKLLLSFSCAHGANCDDVVLTTEMSTQIQWLALDCQQTQNLLECMLAVQNHQMRVLYTVSPTARP